MPDPRGRLYVDERPFGTSPYPTTKPDFSHCDVCEVPCGPDLELARVRLSDGTTLCALCWKRELDDAAGCARAAQEAGE